ncbi:MAG TPA: GNAT family N-acetyltransferase [Candidatus Acidoferrum sp.]|nr:GNAT family N-acetyltransferase [Candidatus Acidoferrum sp.]
MNIRELRKDDLPPLLELYGHLHDTDTPLPAKENVEALWQQIRHADHLKYFGGFVDGQLVSSCTIAIIPNLTRSCRPYAVIENVVTHKQFRRRGYGQAALKAALDFAWSNDCYKVMLMTGRLDEGTFRFYESAGFSRHDKQAFVVKR